MLGSSMAKKTYVDDAVADSFTAMEQQTQELEYEHSETRKKLETLTDNTVKDLTERFQGLEMKFVQVSQVPSDLRMRLEKLSVLLGEIEALKNTVIGMSEVFDHEDKRHQDENWETER